MLTDLPIDAGDPCVLFLVALDPPERGSFAVPVSPPMFGVYDAYGSIEYGTVPEGTPLTEGRDRYNDAVWSFVVAHIKRAHTRSTTFSEEFDELHPIPDPLTLRWILDIAERGTTRDNQALYIQLESGFKREPELSEHRLGTCLMHEWAYQIVLEGNHGDLTPSWDGHRTVDVERLMKDAGDLLRDQVTSLARLDTEADEYMKTATDEEKEKRRKLVADIKKAVTSTTLLRFSLPFSKALHEYAQGIHQKGLITALPHLQVAHADTQLFTYNLAFARKLWIPQGRQAGSQGALLDLPHRLATATIRHIERTAYRYKELIREDEERNEA